MESFSGTYGIDLTAVRRQWHVWNVKIFLMVLMSRPNIQWHTWNYRIIQWHTRNYLNHSKILATGPGLVGFPSPAAYGEGPKQLPFFSVKSRWAENFPAPFLTELIMVGVESVLLRVRVLRPAAPALSGLGGAVASASPRRGRCLFLRPMGSLPSSFSDLHVSLGSRCRM